MTTVNYQLKRMRNLLLIIFILSLLPAPRAFAQLQPVGQWREHLSYNQATRVVTTNTGIFCATPWSLFSVDISDNSINRFSTLNGLHETGVRTIAWDGQLNKLIVAYTNSDIDILDGNKIYNISDILQKDIPGDKTVYNIFCSGGNAYLADGLGVIVLDETKNEVKDTWVIGNTGNNVKVNGLTTDDFFFYAATTEGLKKAPVSGVNLSDYRNWQNLGGANGLGAGPCQDVLNLQGAIVAQQSDSLLVQNGSSWNLLYTSAWSIANTTVSANRLMVSQQLGPKGRVLVINGSGVVEQTVIQGALPVAPAQAVLLQGQVWVADTISGLLRFDGASVERYQPNSPLSIALGQMAVRNGVVWVASGAVTGSWTNTSTKNGLYRFGAEQWTNYNSSSIPALDSLYDIITVAINSADTSAWAGSFGGGLLHLQATGSLQVFKQNSPLPASAADPTKYNVAGLAFDNDNNLWITSYGSNRALSVKKTDGSWRSFSPPYVIPNNAFSQVVIDDYNQKWIVCPGGNGLLCFNHGQTIDNPADDRWKLYQTGVGSGNLPSNNVLCIARDKNSFIWTGTDKGIGIIQCAQQVFDAGSCDAVLPIVQQDNFAGYLFSAEQVQSIAVDGADRKWVGTKNGVWLISPDAQKIIYRFTSANSLLLNNDVRKIAIDGASGEVFFATISGICSFRSTATDGGETNSNVLVFPNPVPPGYTGSIAIRGLADNAVVKITELNGRLVYETRALGGQATWNGKDYNGRTAATGVYLVLVSDDSRQEKIATKIVFIGK